MGGEERGLADHTQPCEAKASGGQDSAQRGQGPGEEAKAGSNGERAPGRPLLDSPGQRRIWYR